MAGAKTEGRAVGNHRAAAHLPLRDWHQCDKSIGTKSRVSIQYFILFTHGFWRRAKSKETEVHTTRPDATLDDAIQQMVQYDIGSLVVCAPVAENAEPRVIGIVTERDILRARAARHVSLEEVRVDLAMKNELITTSPEDRIEHVMAIMTQHRVRHLPVLSCGRLVGIVSIGDVIKALLDAQTMEIFYMRSYIQGEGAEIATPLDEQN